LSRQLLTMAIWKFSPYFTFRVQGKLLKIGRPDKGKKVLEMSKTMLRRVPIESMRRFYVWAQDNNVSTINFLIYSPVYVTNGHGTWPCRLWTTSTLYMKVLLPFSHGVRMGWESRRQLSIWTPADWYFKLTDRHFSSQAPRSRCIMNDIHEAGFSESDASCVRACVADKPQLLANCSESDFRKKKACC